MTERQQARHLKAIYDAEEERVEKIARAMFDAECAVLGEEAPPERHFKVAIIAYLAMARAALKAIEETKV